MVPGQTVDDDCSLNDVFSTDSTLLQVVMKLPAHAVSASRRLVKLSVKSPAKAEELQSNSSSQQDEIDWVCWQGKDAAISQQ